MSLLKKIHVKLTADFIKEKNNFISSSDTASQIRRVKIVFYRTGLLRSTALGPDFFNISVFKQSPYVKKNLFGARKILKNP